MIGVINANGTPVRNLQTMLRQIAFNDDRFPDVIVDGIFDEITRDAVVRFQTIYSLPQTGEVDIITFEEIVAAYNESLEKSQPPRRTGIIAEADFIIRQGDENEALYVIKAMIKNLAARFDNIKEVPITNLHDAEFVEVIQTIQMLSELEPTGDIDRKTLDAITYLYETQVAGFMNR